MPYTVNAQDPTQPLDTDDISFAAAEFWAIKAYYLTYLNTKVYTDAQDAATLAAADAYALSIVNAGIVTAENYAAVQDTANLAAAKAYTDAAVTHLGNVPGPITGTDDGKLLTASGGLFSWVTALFAAISSLTGSLKLPSGTTAQRDVSPSFGWVRANSTLSILEWWTGATWQSLIASGQEFLTNKNAINGYAGLTVLKLNLWNTAGTFTNFIISLTTAVRTWTMPDKSGTVALLSDTNGIASILCTQASGSLTFTLNPITQSFRSATLTDGTSTSVETAAAVTLVLPSGGTLGGVSGQVTRIYEVQLSNGELAIVNSAGGNDLSETGVISTTAISAAATTNNVFYSTTARTGLPYRVIGYADAVNTAGAWGNPTLVQGAGGQARMQSAKSGIRLNTANGYGSTNTVIRRFTNVVTNQGTDITYADSATLGATFTINVAGVYAISYSDQFNAASSMAISLNSAQLTTAVQSLTVGDILTSDITVGANYASGIAVTLYLPVGSIIRAHTDGLAAGASVKLCQFTIQRTS